MTISKARESVPQPPKGSQTPQRKGKGRKELKKMQTLGVFAVGGPLPPWFSIPGGAWEPVKIDIE
jgi:hypothetical protein